MNKPLILVVEDDAPIRNLITTTLKTQDYKYIAAATASEALQQATIHAPDVMLLDLGLPDLDGIEVIRRIRSWSAMPIIVISARSEDSDKIEALDSGADDYLTKPFRIPELRARVNAHIRREQRERHSSLNFERIRIDLSAKTVQVDGEIISLTKSEYMICEFLARNKGQVFTREQIYEAVFSLDGESDNSTIATHIKNIRAKLNQYCIQPITTVWGIGYKWE